MKNIVLTMFFCLERKVYIIFDMSDGEVFSKKNEEKRYKYLGVGKRNSRQYFLHLLQYSGKVI